LKPARAHRPIASLGELIFQPLLLRAAERRLPICAHAGSAVILVRQSTVRRYSKMLVLAYVLSAPLARSRSLPADGSSRLPPAGVVTQYDKTIPLQGRGIAELAAPLIEASRGGQCRRPVFGGDRRRRVIGGDPFGVRVAASNVASAGGIGGSRTGSYSSVLLQPRCICLLELDLLMVTVLVDLAALLIKPCLTPLPGRTYALLVLDRQLRERGPFILCVGHDHRAQGDCRRDALARSSWMASRSCGTSAAAAASELGTETGSRRMPSETNVLLIAACPLESTQ
jgi:hypothetical protein